MRCKSYTTPLRRVSRLAKQREALRKDCSLEAFAFSSASAPFLAFSAAFIFATLSAAFPIFAATLATSATTFLATASFSASAAFASLVALLLAFRTAIAIDVLMARLISIFGIGPGFGAVHVLDVLGLGVAVFVRPYFEGDLGPNLYVSQLSLVDEDIPPKFLVGRRAVDESEAMLGIERLDSALEPAIF